MIKDKLIHEALLIGYTENILNLGLYTHGVTYSPITGSAGNIEFWFDITFSEKDAHLIDEETIKNVVEEAHLKLGKK